jgi:predicted permease
MSLINTIRNKPQNEKIRLIWIIIIIVIVLLILLWIATSKIFEDRPKDTTLFQTLGRGLRDIKEKMNKN